MLKNTISKAVAAFAIAATTVLAAPAMANAYTPAPVVPNGQIVAPGGTVTIAFAGFAPSESVTHMLSGENGAGASLAAVRTAAGVSSTSIEKAADADGASSVSVTLPDNARGDYTLTATGQDSGESAEVTISVAATGADDDGALIPGTGFDGDALLGLWVGGGVLILAGSAIAVATTVRRTRPVA